jgi:hypothetical protein
MVASKKTRRGRLGVVSRLWSPFSHLLSATGDSVQEVGSTTGRILKETVGLPRRVGNTFARHSNMAVRNVLGSRRTRSKRSLKKKTA